MKIEFTDSFGKSLKKLVTQNTWWYKTYDFFCYDLPYFFKNLWYFRKEIWEHRPWDYTYSLMMLRRSLESLSNTLEFNGYEVSESRNKKIEKINRAIELITRVKSNDYINDSEKELGEIIKRDLDFEKLENGNYKMVDNETDVEKAHNKKVYKRANEIEEKEWIELWTIFMGQNHKDYIKLLKSESKEDKKTDLWYKWFDGSGMAHWWD